MILWLCDKWSRGVAASRIYVPQEIHWHARNETTLLKLSKDSIACLSYEPGQYFFVNIPEISLNEWHPFTATAILDDGIVFCIKRLKTAKLSQARTWTQRLADIVQDSSDPNQPKEASAAVASRLALRLSGPFGHTDFTSYEKLLLVAGGIGITPMIAIFAHLKKRQLLGQDIGRLKHVQLVWMSRSVGEFTLFEKVLSVVAEDGRKALKQKRTSKMNSYITPETTMDHRPSLSFNSNSKSKVEVPVSLTTDHMHEKDVTYHASLPFAQESSYFTPPVVGDSQLQRPTVITTGNKQIGVEQITNESDSDFDGLSLQHPCCPTSGIEKVEVGLNSACAKDSPLSTSAKAGPSTNICDPNKQKRLSIDSFGEQHPFSIPCKFELNLYCTRRASFAALSDPQSADFVNLFVHNGRCGIKETFEIMGMKGGTCIAAVCGPVPLMLDVSESARREGCDFHSEQFLF